MPRTDAKDWVESWPDGPEKAIGRVLIQNEETLSDEFHFYISEAHFKNLCAALLEAANGVTANV